VSSRSRELQRLGTKSGAVTGMLHRPTWKTRHSVNNVTETHPIYCIPSCQQSKAPSVHLKNQVYLITARMPMIPIYNNCSRVLSSEAEQAWAGAA
jgi:hypothetical protein